MPTSGPSTLRIEPAALQDAATRFRTMAATVTDHRASLASTAASCCPALGGAVQPAAVATSHTADRALEGLSKNYAAISAALAQLATTYPRIDAGALGRPPR